jgi:hypothetical protein
MGDAHESNTSMTQAEKELNKIDVELKDYMIHAEQKCRKIRIGQIPFSPEAGKWIRRLQIYGTLLRQQRGQRCNPGNLCRAALRGGINNPFELSEHEILLRIKVCREHCDFYREHGQQYQTRHLRWCAKEAKESGSEDAAMQILQIIQRERFCTFWRRLKCAVGSQSGQSVQRVQVETAGGKIREYSNQTGIEKAIWSNIHHKRFYLAKEAPICQPPLWREFGYCAQTAGGGQSSMALMNSQLIQTRLLGNC